MKLSIITTALLLCAAVCTPADAQTSAAQGSGTGPGYGRAVQFKFNQDNTRGWALMTDQERSAHHAKMMATTSYEGCKAVQSEQHQIMESRAKDRGVPLPAARQNACDRMKAQGLFK